jgi:acyl-CoA dehydrogenase
MDLGVTKKVRPLIEAVREMVNDEIVPLEAEFYQEVENAENRFSFTPRMTEILEGLKEKARDRGLWNFWLNDSKLGHGLSTVEYAYLAQEMRSPFQAEVFNCSAPDTGNMEVLARYANEEHKQRWLTPLLDGKIRSAYLMTEPDVASSDATNIQMSCVRKGNEYVLNGEKWWSSGAGDPRCNLYIVMVRTAEDGTPKHRRNSMLLVPSDTAGIEILRPMQVYGHDEAPHGHMHIRFSNVRVPLESLLLEEGSGFEISQGRLGPGRIHHCMRAIGQAELALELMCRRSLQREAFGKKLADLGANYDIIAECRMEIEQARLLCLKAAWMMS